MRRFAGSCCATIAFAALLACDASAADGPRTLGDPREAIARLDAGVAVIDGQVAAVDLSEVFRAEGLASGAMRARVRRDLDRLARLADLRDALVDRTSAELRASRASAAAAAMRAHLQDYAETAAALHALSHAERTTVDALRDAIDFAEDRLRPADAIAGRLVFRTDADLRRWQALQRRLDAAVALENSARANFLGLQHRASTRVAER